MAYNYKDDPFLSLAPPEKDGTYTSIANGFRGGIKEAREIFSGKIKGRAYARKGLSTPTVREFEEMVTDAECALSTELLDTIATGAGLSAIFILFSHLTLFTQKREIIISPSVYGGSYFQFTEIFPHFHIYPRVVKNPDNPESWKESLTNYCAGALLETVSNPIGAVPDLPAISKILHGEGIYVVADNTLPTPEGFNPLLHGADFVVHSGSKVMNGKSTCLCGTITGPEKHIRQIKETFFAGIGPVLDGSAASRMLNGMETLPERSRRHARNAMVLASRLEDMRMTPGSPIKKVHYPMLNTSPYYKTASRLGLRQGGCVVATELNGTAEYAEKYIDRLDNMGRVIHATHLGHKKTLVTYPAGTTHSPMRPELREYLGITDTLIRFSTGCEEDEEFEQVWRDIKNAF